jgi:carbon storage regulator CsrA
MGNLVISRRIGERLRLLTCAGEAIWIRISRVDRGQVKVSIDAPSEVNIIREELLPPDQQYDKDT